VRAAAYRASCNKYELKGMKWVWIVAAGLSFSILFSFRDGQEPARKQKLSEFGFFVGDIKKLEPAEGVTPYTLNSPLFSNYAEKLRFLRLPPGERAVYNDSVVFDFPVGTVFIKNFYFPNDFRRHDGARKIIETRLLVRLASGWEAWPYIWNDEQTDAVYDPAGETKIVSYNDKSGRKITTPYAIPNKNQCKGCHIRNQEMLPLGPSARQLNGDFKYENGNHNQLEYWKNAKLIEGVSESSIAPRLAVWNDASSGDLNSRARAYLDVNCGHCHSRQGPANTSGLFLDITETDATHLGVNKPPVAAGRGAGELQFDIVPGQPQKSILVYRMKTNDPAIAMPEIGREQVHKEGLALIEEWIRKNSF
jgi:uncharacterized repeat protein (TIGR03806 family)